MILPMAAVVAGQEPEMAAKIMEARMAAMDKPPLIPPTSRLAKFTNRLEMPPVAMTLPARMKKGIAIREKEFTEVNMA